MQPLLKDLAFLRSAAAELEPYLLSNELYWQLTPVREDRGTGNLISLTPGNLTISLMKVKSFPWSEAESRKHALVVNQIEVEINKWRSAWRKKVEREVAARLKQWQDYLAEVSQDSTLVDYTFKVRCRVILDCFETMDATLTPAQSSLLFLLDERLKHLTLETGFIWEAEVAGGFKRDVFWYLFRIPAKG